jgi:uncharacterized protein (TIGR00251 family)
MAFAPHERAGAVWLDILVAPRASRPGVGPVVGDRLKIAVGAAPQDGEANRAVVAILAGALGVRASAVAIVRGQSSRRKTVSVAGATVAQVLALAAAQ